MSIDTSTDPSSRSTPAEGTPRSERPRSGGGLFRAFWRWHLFASVLVVPVLVLLSVTGLIYLFRFQLEPMLHPDLMRLQPAAATAVEQPASAQLAAVVGEFPGATVVSMTEPGAADEPSRFSIVTADGAARDVFVDPHGPKVLGSLDPDTTLSGYALRLHGELMSGRLGDAVIELGACWAIVMALTGYYLFVRGRRARRLALRRAREKRVGLARARLRWTHAGVGAFVGAGLLLLLVSGLPWTGFWGEKVQQLASERGTSLWSTDPGAVSDPTSTLDESLPHSHATDVPWALQESEVPRSQPVDAGQDGERSVASIDTAVEVADREGLRHPFTVALPESEDGVFSVIGYAFDAPSDERTVHVDRFGGQAISTYGYDDYPALAKVVSQGIGLHEGRSLGLWSFWGAALMCVAILFACVSGPLLWWSRRPRGAGRIGAPRGRMPLRRSPLLLLGVVALGVVLPLFGASLLLVLALDQLVLRRVPALAQWFDVA
ncbi:PepSY domain-containing protein [Nocardioides sp. TRM66260-LWL]|uniref:PepSY-associated TM helix domain-containing protein n=1 Tax=Nocardioides sp. TRM66260-LWL TaxID=2874478 RepID=UPI001CC65DA1|nr:PepSY domain-containing protein [Nocardioides sp. TRM66260-LWL]MBZ5736027.1 PepSY domain-containing protein [Nocardioides sp. TRM66260-LWL]